MPDHSAARSQATNRLLRAPTVLAIVGVAVLITSTYAAATHLSAAPMELVLQRSEVPDGFELEPTATHPLSNAAFARGQQQLRQLVARSGRISGYRVTYSRPGSGETRTIASTVHLCDSAAGARELFAFAAAEQRRFNASRVERGGRAYRYASDVLNDDSVVYWQRARPYYTVVVWRSGRTVAVISTWGLGRVETIELARIQERRIRKLTRR